MTILDKRNRIERLAEEPLFFYRTLRDRVEELDSLKAAFQYLLAAYELNMDPAIKAQYEDAKRAAREAQLRDSAATTAAAQLDQEPSIVRHAVLDPGVSHPPEILAKMESQRSGEAMSEVVKGSGMPDAKRPDLAPKAPRPISPRAEASGAVAEAIKEVRGDYGRAVQTLEGSIPKFALSDESILEAKRVLSRQKVAEEVNKVLVQHGVHFTDAQLIDYMDNKMSKEDLERVGQMVDTREAHHDHNPLEKPVVHESVEEDNEFPLTQVGLAQKMFYGKDGLLPKILSSTLTKHGQGPISQADGKVDLRVDHPRSGMITLDQMDESGIYQDAGYSNGILIILEKTDAHPWKYFVWMPQYHTDHREPPMIYCTKYPAHGFCPLTDMATAEVSDVINRLVHYIVKWQAKLRERDSTTGNSGTTLRLVSNERHIAQQSDRNIEFLFSTNTVRHPDGSSMRESHRKLYDTDGVLASILGREFHVFGKGPLHALKGNCGYRWGTIVADPVPLEGFQLSFQSDVSTGVWRAKAEHGSDEISGVLVIGDRGVAYWLPLYLDMDYLFPNVYVAVANTYTFRNISTFPSQDADVLMTFLFSTLKGWCTQGFAEYPGQSVPTI
jgi:hypothetical protein